MTQPFPEDVAVEIDLNVRCTTWGATTFVGLEDVPGDPGEMRSVTVYESESGLAGLGEICCVDREHGLVYIYVDWSQLAFDPRYLRDEGNRHE